MGADASNAASGADGGAAAGLRTLCAEAAEILHALQEIQQEFGAYLEQLATVDWAALAQQGKLAGVPKFMIERTITDARNVLANGLKDLADILRQAQEPGEDTVERLQAFMRLYVDTPGDLRTRQQRLMHWMARIEAAPQPS
jgi:hypothetical protein